MFKAVLHKMFSESDRVQSLVWCVGVHNSQCEMQLFAIVVWYERVMWGFSDNVKRICDQRVA